MTTLVKVLKAFLPLSQQANGPSGENLESSAPADEEDSSTQQQPPSALPPDEIHVRWKEERNEMLSRYMECRMIAPEQKEEGEDEDYQVPDNDELNVPFWDEQANDDSPSPTSPQSLSRAKIPYIDDTLHVAKTLSSLDLHAKEFHLSLGLLEKAWTLRDVNRRQYTQSTRFEDDGPLATIYKQVLCVEVKQLLQQDDISQRAQAAFGGTSFQRMRIFFYNKYAAQVSSLLQQEHSTRILVSLQHVPAKCILPMKFDDSWYDQEGLCPYGVCIGDRSSVKLDLDGAGLVRVHFDHEDLQITFTRISGDSTVEAEITPDSVRNGAATLKETSVLEPAYQEWEKAQQAAQEEKEDDDDNDMLVDESTTDEQAPREAGAAGRATGNVRRAEAANSGRKAKRAKAAVKYNTLAEIRDLFEAQKSKATTSPMFTVNLYGTVLGFSAPTLTKAHDYMLNLAIVDETTPLPTSSDDGEEESVAATTVLIFCRELDQIPKFVRAGDVVRMHRVGVQEWKDELQLIGRRASSYVVVRPKASDGDAGALADDWEIAATAKGGTTFGAQDTERAAALWHWAQKRIASYPTIKVSTKMRLSDLGRQDLHDSSEDKSGDLTVMVGAILSVPNELKTTATPLGFIRVWDGTGAPTSDPMPIASADAGASLKNGDPPNEALQSIASVIETLKTEAGEDADDDVATLEPPTCLCGRVANVAVWEEPHWETVTSELHVGSFIRLRNVHESRLNNGLRCLFVSSKSGLTPLPDYTFEIKEVLKEHQKRVQRHDPVNPQSGVLPLDEEDVPAVAAAPAQDAMDVDETTMETRQKAAPNTDGVRSIAQIRSGITSGTFTAKFRVIRTIPSATRGAHGLRNLCFRSGPSEDDIQFQFAVRISDGTGEIEPLVSNEIGEKMIQMTASDAYETPTSDVEDIVRNITREGTWWKGKIELLQEKGTRFFVLRSLSTE